MVKGFIHENTQKKVRICSAKETLESMMEHIDISQIPEYYGGNLRFDPPPGYNGPDRSENKESCRFFSPEVLNLAEYTKRLNDGSLHQQRNNTEEMESSKHEHHPPGTPGEIQGRTHDHDDTNKYHHGSNDYNSPANGSTMSTLTPPSVPHDSRNRFNGGPRTISQENLRHYGDDDYSIISSSTITR